MTFLPLILQMIAGAIGGHTAGTASKDTNLGGVGNTVVGLLGGAGAGQLLGMLLPALGSMAAADAGGGTGGAGAAAGDLIGGGIGGAVLTAIVGLIKNKMAGPAAAS
jgi:hypothetical protein